MPQRPRVRLRVKTSVPPLLVQPHAQISDLQRDGMDKEEWIERSVEARAAMLDLDAEAYEEAYDEHYAAEWQAFEDYISGAELSAAHSSSACGAEPWAAHTRFGPLFGVGHPMVEKAYRMIREQGASLSQERLQHQNHTRDTLRLFWVKQNRRSKGDWAELKKSFKDLSVDVKVKNLEKFLMSDDCSESQRLDATRILTHLWMQMCSVEVPKRGKNSKRQPKAQRKRREYFLNSVGRVLLTWIGMWGRLEPMCVPTLDLQTADLESLCVDSLCAELAQLPQVREMWEKVKAALATLVSQLRAFRYTGSMELCTDTLLKEKRLQLHVHLFVHSGYSADQPPFRVESAQSLELFGVPPHMSACHSAVKARGRNSNEASAAAGHYYLAMPKKGKVFMHWANVEPFKQYGVKDQWIHQFWQQDKLSNAAARAEFVNCKKGIRQHTENVELYERLVREREAESRRAVTAAALLQMTLPNVVIPEVAAWVESRKTLRDRYKFLVLEGVSQVGKTSFARGLMGREACLVMDCSGDNTPCLRQYDGARHHVLVFDEGKASMVLCHKKLFQASIDEVTCGSSPTNQHAYVVCVHAACIIVTSNTWSEDLAGASEADREWLVNNSLHLRIFGALWQKPGGDGIFKNLNANLSKNTEAKKYKILG